MVFIEPFILYWVLFLPTWGIGSARTLPEVLPPECSADALNFIPFVPASELGRIFTYNIPSLALIWYLLILTRSISPTSLRTRGRDFGVFILAFPGLLVLGFLVSLASSLVPSVSSPVIGAPQGPAAFLVMALSALSTGYLEESYFRLYLFTRFREGGIGPVPGMICSSLLFALCHLYEGPLGILNAFLAGMFLFFLFSRRQSIHGLAWAHGGYNIFVYIMAGMAGT
jgi:membrane protease YdiL (CAAX protease family)